MCWRKRKLRSTAKDKWLWNFGTSYREYGPSLTRSYAKESDHSFILIGKTIHACQDTVIRPFRIYDNKAFAGRDTIVAIDQPVQLNANGGLDNTYLWSPSIGLNDANKRRSNSCFGQGSALHS